jgi:lactate dehydrogenase-like 2-hydroxyacid dehydrogenase
MPGVIYTRRLPPAIEEELHRLFDARHVDPAGEDVARTLDGVWGIVVVPGTRCDAAMIARLPACVRILASYSVGVDHIDLEAAAARGIAVSNTPDVLTDATADIAMLLILAACRAATRAEHFLRSGRWRGISLLDMFGVDLAGRTLGILGFGRIGRATARRARAFGMSIVYHGPRARPEAVALEARYEPERGDFLAASDVVSLHAPLTPATRHIIDATALAAMRPGSILVNTARGSLVDDSALIDALRRGHLRAAGLDVYEGEPDINPAYLELDNVTLLPHIGSATIETRHAMGRKVIANLTACAAGRPMPDRVV